MATTPALTYATPAAAADGSPVAAGVWVMIGGLVLILFGGCFCIGILMLLGNGMFPNSDQAERDHVTRAFSGVALCCFAAGAYVMFLGLRKLLAVGR